MDNSYKDLEDPSVFVKFPLNYYKTGVGVGVVIENEKGEIFLVRRNEPGRDRLMGLVGGKYEEVDNGDLEATARREVKEEISCDVDSLEYYGYSVDVFEGRMFKTHHFKAKVSGEIKITDDAGTEKTPVWTKKDEIPWDDLHVASRNCLKNIVLGEKQ